MQIYLNLAGRDPAGGGLTSRCRGRRTSRHGRADQGRVPRRSGTPTTGPATASPRAGRSSTGPSPRPRPGTSRTARAPRPTWPTRRAPATSSSSPTRRTSSTPRRPGTLIAPSQFFGQHGYVPDVQDLDSNINMRATFLAGGDGIDQRHGQRPAPSTSRPTLAYLLGIPEPQHSQGKVLPRRAQGRPAASSRSRSSGSTTSTVSSTRPRRPIDGIDRPGRRRRPAGDDVRRGRWPALPGPGAAAGRRRQRRRLAAELGPARGQAGDRRRERLGPRRDVVRQPRVRLRRRPAARAAGARPLPVPGRPTSSRPRPGKAPVWVKPSGRSTSTASGSASSAPSSRTPRSWSRPATRPGSTFLPEAERIKAESERLRKQGVKVQVVVIHEGTDDGHQHDRQHAGHAVGRPDHRHRRRAPGHDRRRDDRRAHPPRLQPDGRRHPRHRGHQRRRELLGPAADGQGRRRRLGRRRDPRRQGPRRRARGPTCRRSSTRPTPTRRCCATR